MQSTQVHVGFFEMPEQRVLHTIALLRVIYGTVFLSSGIFKLIDLPSFATAIDAFRVIPLAMVSYAEYLIPLAEVLLGTCIIFGFMTALMSFLTGCMLAIFSGLIGEKLIEGARIGCGCFGPLSGEAITGASLIRNIVLSVWGALLTSLSLGVHWKSQREEGGPKNGGTIFDARTMLSLRGAIQRAGLYTIGFFTIGLLSLLEFQNVALKNRLAMVVDQQVLKPGDTVPGFRAVGLDGNGIQVRYDSTSNRTMLLLFSTQCSACRDNLANWDELAKSAREHQGWRVLGVSMSSLENSRRFSQDHAFNYPILVASDLAFRRGYKASLTPQTVVVDSIGRVEVIWTGVLNPEVKAEALRTIRSSPMKRENPREARVLSDNPAMTLEQVR